MSSIVAWNMRGFKKPHKQKAVKCWVKDAKLSIGGLMETRVQESNFKKIFEATFPGWNCINNYSHHRLGRLWVCWSEEVEVCQVLTSAQMIKVWVR